MFEDKPRKKLAKKVQVRLTPLQWANIAARIRFGESKSSLAREYGITRQAIHGKLPGLQEESPIETAASKIVIAHEYVQSGVKGMHPKLQVEAWDMAKNLISISENLTEGALYGAMNFFKLAKLAQEMTETMLEEDKVDINTLGAISAITKTANEAAAPSMNLLNINKQTVDRLTKTGDIIGKKTLADFYGIPTLVDDQDKDNK